MAPFSGLRATLTQIYPPPKPVFTEAHVPAGSLQGRVYIVTGGNAGIGLELVKILYAGGGTVYIASRSKDKVEAAIKDIITSHKSSNASSTTHGKLKFLHLDLNDLKTVKAAAASFAEQESQLDDFELFIGRHCIATLLFTQLLLPQLRAAAAAASPRDGGQTRVIWTSSGLAEAGSPPNGIDWKVIDQGANQSAQNYGASKAGTWFLSREFARRYKQNGIVSVCLNPGYLKTASFNGTPALVMLILKRVMLSEPIFGAYTELFAGLSPEVTLETSGTYIIPWGRIRPNTATGRQDLVKAGDSKEEGGLGYGEKLWDWCEKQWAAHV